MNDKHKEKRDLEYFMEYLRKSGYEQTFVYLAHSQEQIRARKYLLDETINNLKQKMKIPITTDKEDLARKIKETHALQFDLIGKIFMMIEDLIYFYDVLSTEPKNLPFAMVINRRVNKKRVLQEWRKMMIPKIMRIFKFPSLSDRGISKDERSFVEAILRKQTELIQTKLSRIRKFWTNYIDVYNVYKHGLSAITGFHSIESGRIISLFLVRRMHKFGKERRICTYHVPVSPDTVEYFDQIFTDTHSLMKLLIDSFIRWIRNEEGFFILPIWRDELKLTEKERELLDIIIRKLRFKIPGHFVTEIKIHGKRKEIMKRDFAKKHIHRNCRFDIFQELPKYVIS